MRPGFVLLFMVLVLIVACEKTQTPPDANLRPLLEILQPSEGEHFTVGTTITLEVDAEDIDGSVERVVFYVGGRVVSTQTQEPYRYTFEVQHSGPLMLAALAYDDDNASSVSQSITVEVDETPPGTHTLTLKVNGSGTVNSDAPEFSCSDACSYAVAEGSEVSLRAVPATGALFESWTGCSSTLPDCTLTLSSDKQVEASFSQVNIEISIDPANVTLSSGQGQTFTASVTGSDEGVSWSKTGGGSLIANGLSADYTAPGTLGSFEVTATSTEDPSKSATATVQVEALHPADAFTIIALPDTQSYTCVGDDGDGCGGATKIYKEGFIAQTQWIVDNLETENIAFVTHEGDMVDNAKRETEWRNAEEAMGKLDGKVPYSVAIGDHDYGPEEHHDGDTSLFRKYYGPNRYSGYSWYGGASPNQLSHYQVVTMGGIEFLHIALEWEAPSAAVAWTKSVLEAHPNTPTIITTHAYLVDGDDSAGFSTTVEACVGLSSNADCPDPGNDADASNGKQIFEQLVAPYPQVFMVLNGHYHNGGRRDGCTGGIYACNNGEYRLASKNAAGSIVYQMLANYQDYDNGGDGWLRIIRFLPGGGDSGLDRIEVETYSPTLDAFQTDSASKFHYDLDFSERFDLSD